MLQYLEGFLLQTCCMAQTAHSWTPGVVKQPSNGKNGLKDSSLNFKSTEQVLGTVFNKCGMSEELMNDR